MASPMFPVIFSLPWKNACESEREKCHPDSCESEVRFSLYWRELHASFKRYCERLTQPRESGTQQKQLMKCQETAWHTGTEWVELDKLMFVNQSAGGNDLTTLNEQIFLEY